MTESLGWISSLILSVTLFLQIRKQWKEKTSHGVSHWLFAGQVVAEIGFIIYSVLVENWVFAATNVVLLIENFVGLWVTIHFKKANAA